MLWRLEVTEAIDKGGKGVIDRCIHDDLAADNRVSGHVRSSSFGDCSDEILVAAQRSIPKGVELVAQGKNCGFVEVVDAARAIRLLGDQSGVLQYLEMLGHRRAAHREGRGELADRARSFA